MATDDNAITSASYTLNEMFRAYVPSVQNRVFPPGTRQDSRVPRITISPLTPTEKRVGIGERYGTGMGVWLLYMYKVDIWSKDANQVEKAADEVMRAVWQHRNYSSSTRSADGQFVNLEIAGGAATAINQAMQMYQRTINVKGKWLSKAQEVF